MMLAGSERGRPRNSDSRPYSSPRPRLCSRSCPARIALPSLLLHEVRGADPGDKDATRGGGANRTRVRWGPGARNLGRSGRGFRESRSSRRQIRLVAVVQQYSFAI